MFSCEYCESFKNTSFEEHLRMNASYFMKKNRHSTALLSNSSKKIEINENLWNFNFVYTNFVSTNLSRCQVEDCPALPGQNLISTCNRRVKSIPAGRVEILSQQTGIMLAPPNVLGGARMKELKLRIDPVLDPFLPIFDL